MFSLILTGTNNSENNRDPGDLRRLRAHYDVTIMSGDLHTIYTSNQLNFNVY